MHQQWRSTTHKTQSFRLSKVALILGLLVLAPISSSALAQSCPAAGYNKQSLMELRQNKWDIKNDKKRQETALALLPCLASPDPQLRDEIAFEALSFWMRNKLLDTISIRQIEQQLLKQLADTKPAANADYGKPFAALTLAEVSRVDRLQAFMSDEERKAMVDAAVQYLSTITDYRGFDEKEGWRHGVAHAADWMLQLALNPQISVDQHQQILNALATQIKTEKHFYTYGEPERLMAPVFFIAMRSKLDNAAWKTWFDELLQGSPSASQGNTQAALARRHNLKAFLQAFYVNVQESKQEQIKERLLPLIISSLKKLN